MVSKRESKGPSEDNDDTIRPPTLPSRAMLYPTEASSNESDNNEIRNVTTTTNNERCRSPLDNHKKLLAYAPDHDDDEDDDDDDAHFQRRRPGAEAVSSGSRNDPRTRKGTKLGLWAPTPPRDGRKTKKPKGKGAGTTARSVSPGAVPETSAGRRKRKGERLGLDAAAVTQRKGRSPSEKGGVNPTASVRSASPGVQAVSSSRRIRKGELLGLVAPTSAPPETATTTNSQSVSSSRRIRKGEFLGLVAPTSAPPETATTTNSQSVSSSRRIRKGELLGLVAPTSAPPDTATTTNSQSVSSSRRIRKGELLGLVAPAPSTPQETQAPTISQPLVRQGSGRSNTTSSVQDVEQPPIVSSDSRSAIAAEIVMEESDIQQQIYHQVDHRVEQRMQHMLDSVPAAIGVSKNEDKGGGKRTRFMALACCLLVIAAAIGVTVGVLVTQSSSSSPPPDQPMTCSFCYGGNTTSFSDNMLRSESVSDNNNNNNVSCSLFRSNQEMLLASDTQCTLGQALAWRHCGCPSLPPVLGASVNCTFCSQGHKAIQRNAMDNCGDETSFLSIVGTLEPPRCTGLVEQVSSACFCPTDYYLLVEDAVSDLVTDPSIFGNARSRPYQALNWMAFADPHNSTNTSVIRERFAIVLLYLSTGGANWTRGSLNFLSGTSVCDWNNVGTGSGVYCENGSVVEVNLGKWGLACTESWLSLTPLFFPTEQTRGTSLAQFPQKSRL